MVYSISNEKWGDNIMVNYEKQLNKLYNEHHNKIKEKEMKSNDNTTI